MSRYGQTYSVSDSRYLNATMRFIVFAMLIGCVLAASVDRVRRDDGDEGSNESDNLELRVRRADGDKSVDCPATLWKDGNVCYTIDSSVDSKMKTVLLSVFKRFEDVSCVKFIDKNADTDKVCGKIGAMPVKLVENTNSKCWATIGCSANLVTSINMDPNCASSGVVTHEVFHALGRYHEQSRRDRDANIIVNWDNILEGNRGNYKRCSNDPYDVPYDFQSIMHYGDRFFLSKNPTGSKETMTIKDDKFAVFQKLMGSQQKLSRWDIVTLNKMYKCPMPAGVKCQHGGIEIPDGSCDCIELPFTGSDCGEVDTTKGILVNIKDGDVVSSQNFPKNYPINVKEYVVLQCPEGKRVSITFEAFKVEKDGPGCGYDWLQLFPNVGQIYGLKYCGTSLKGATILSEGNYLVFKFYTNESFEYEGYKDQINCVD